MHGPPDPKRVSPGAVVRRGPFVSVQVNVDEHGMNILDDAANEPSIAVDPTNPDRMVIGWRQFDTAWRVMRQAGFTFTEDGGRTWALPGVLTPGQLRDDPVLDADADGNFYYHRASGIVPPHGDLLRSDDGGRTWKGPYPTGARNWPWMIVDRTTGAGRGHVYVAAGGEFMRSVDGGQSFEPSHRAENADRGTVCVARDSAVYVVSSGGRVSRSDNAKDPAVMPIFEPVTAAPLGGAAPSHVPGSPNPDGLLGRCWIAVDESKGPYADSLYVLNSVRARPPDYLDVNLARSRDGGKSWAGPIRINDDALDVKEWQWFGTMSVSPQTGRIDVVWNDTRSTVQNRESELYYAYSCDGGQTFSRNMPIGPVFDSWVGFPSNEEKLGDYYHMRSDEKGGRLAYAATYNGEQDVYYLHTVLDCNDNGLHDGDDVALGRSPDVNKNGVPDDCFCDPLRSFVSNCVGGRLEAHVRSSFPEGTQLSLYHNGEPVPLIIDSSGSAKLVTRVPEQGYHMLDLDGCPLWGQTVHCGPPCVEVVGLKLTCRSLTLGVRVNTSLPEGYVLHVNIDGNAQPHEVDERGRIRIKLRVQPRWHSVWIEECPEIRKTIYCP